MSSPFQTSVLRTHLNGIDGHACNEAYDRLQAHFGDRTMQDRTVGMREEVKKVLKKYKQPKLSLNQEMEWERVFEEKRAEVLALRVELTKLDREIDVAVYRLYGLTWEEVLVVDATTQEWMSKKEYDGR